MKFFSLILCALSLAACQPMTKTHPKSVGTEAEEEKLYATSQLRVAGFFLKLPDESVAIAAAKQGKAIAREAQLRPDERAEITRLLALVDLSSVRLAARAEDSSLVLSGKYTEASASTNWSREISITLKPAGDAAANRWEGHNSTQNFVVTCLPLENAAGACDPAQSAVIEVLSKLTMSNHRPRTLSFLYTQTDVTTKTDGNLPANVFASSGRGVVRTLAVLNKATGLQSTLSVDLRAWHDMSFVAVNTNNGGYTWEIGDGSWLLTDYTFSRAPLTQPNSINIGLRSQEYANVSGRILTASQRELVRTE